MLSVSQDTFFPLYFLARKYLSRFRRIEGGLQKHQLAGSPETHLLSQCGKVSTLNLLQKRVSKVDLEGSTMI